MFSPYKFYISFDRKLVSPSMQKILVECVLCAAMILGSELVMENKKYILFILELYCLD